MDEFIELFIFDNDLRYFENGDFYRLTTRGWHKIKFTKYTQNNETTQYFKCILVDKDGVQHLVRRHRMVFYAFNQDWDIYDRGLLIDHINHTFAGDGIENLRQVTIQQNSFNKKNVKGYYREGNKYNAIITVNGKKIHLGRFKLKDNARNAYLKAKAIHHLI
tara:strand:- start:85 stop:570 length:486 start_codon:yes stop_codon:yes gene_type:complete